MKLLNRSFIILGFVTLLCGILNNDIKLIVISIFLMVFGELEDVNFNLNKYYE